MEPPPSPPDPAERPLPGQGWPRGVTPSSLRPKLQWGAEAAGPQVAKLRSLRTSETPLPSSLQCKRAQWLLRGRDRKAGGWEARRLGEGA